MKRGFIKHRGNLKETIYNPSVIIYQPMAYGAMSEKYSPYNFTYKTIPTHSPAQHSYDPNSVKQEIFQPTYHAKNYVYGDEKKIVPDEKFRKKEASVFSYQPLTVSDEERITDTSPPEIVTNVSRFFRIFIELVKIFNRWFKK